MYLKTSLALLATLSWTPIVVHAQTFTNFSIEGHPVQIHGFASQGFALSDVNNFLTMKTSSGSPAFTDGGLNISTPLTDKFRVGAQGYVRNIGQLGGGRFSVDWAFGDYRFKDWFGIRAGKVKTALGLFNDTQDAESIHTWAMLPQSVYPLDLRTSLIAHTGGDIYGEFSLRKTGSLSYTAYAGRRANDRRSGYYFNTQDTGVPIQTFTGMVTGVDIRWTTPVAGLMIGGSFLDEMDTIKGVYAPYGNAPYTITTDPQHVTAGYVDYTRGKLRLNAEIRRNRADDTFTVLGQGSPTDQSYLGWFATAAYRVTSRLELGTYHSRFYVDSPSTPEPAANHIFDQTATARFDLTKWSNLKVEGHFMDGYGDLYSAHGFYLRSNPTGTKPKTNMLVIRLGFYL